jgi:hypothetical protein
VGESGSGQGTTGEPFLLRSTDAARPRGGAAPSLEKKGLPERIGRPAVRPNHGLEEPCGGRERRLPPPLSECGQAAGSGVRTVAGTLDREANCLHGLRSPAQARRLPNAEPRFTHRCAVLCGSGWWFGCRESRWMPLEERGTFDARQQACEREKDERTLSRMSSQLLVDSCRRRRRSLRRSDPIRSDPIRQPLLDGFRKSVAVRAPPPLPSS